MKAALLAFRPITTCRCWIIALIATSVVMGTSVYGQTGGLVTSEGYQTLQPMPYGFYGKYVKGHIPAQRVNSGVRMFEIQVTGPFDYDRIDATVRLVAAHLDKIGETINDGRAINTQTDPMHHTVVACMNVKTKEVGWLAISRDGNTRSWHMKSGERVAWSEAEWVTHTIRIDPDRSFGIKLSGADDDHGGIIVGYGWFDGESDWDSPAMSRSK